MLFSSFLPYKNPYTHLALDNIRWQRKAEYLQRQPLVSSSQQSVNLLPCPPTTFYS